MPMDVPNEGLPGESRGSASQAVMMAHHALWFDVFARRPASGGPRIAPPRFAEAAGAVDRRIVVREEAA
ncbi:MAG: hypothetical protein H6738_09365 [Alphaproteobacteria bacterium]|nr:hypothetical protein [Alphaproteobacteria bacterium]